MEPLNSHLFKKPRQRMEAASGVLRCCERRQHVETSGLAGSEASGGVSKRGVLQGLLQGISRGLLF